MGENGSKAEDNGTALRYRCPADGIDDFRADLIEGETFGSLQVTYDIVILYYRGGSLFPCIITHSAINITSVFANVVGLTIEKRIIFQLVLFAITITYSFILTKTLPKNQYYDREDN